MRNHGKRCGEKAINHGNRWDTYEKHQRNPQITKNHRKLRENYSMNGGSNGKHRNQWRFSGSLSSSPWPQARSFDAPAPMRKKCLDSRDSRGPNGWEFPAGNYGKWDDHKFPMFLWIIPPKPLRKKTREFLVCIESFVIIVGIVH